jgi:hypothetical protein
MAWLAALDGYGRGLPEYLWVMLSFGRMLTLLACRAIGSFKQHMNQLIDIKRARQQSI